MNKKKHLNDKQIYMISMLADNAIKNGYQFSSLVLNLAKQRKIKESMFYKMKQKILTKEASKYQDLFNIEQKKRKLLRQVLVDGNIYALERYINYRELKGYAYVYTVNKSNEIPKLILNKCIVLNDGDKDKSYYKEPGNKIIIRVLEEETVYGL